MVLYGMQKTTVYLPDDLKAGLARVAVATRRSEAELIREAICLLVQTKSSPSPRVPLFASNDPDLALRVDDALLGFGEQ